MFQRLIKNCILHECEVDNKFLVNNFALRINADIEVIKPK